MRPDYAADRRLIEASTGASMWIQASRDLHVCGQEIENQLGYARFLDAYHKIPKGAEFIRAETWCDFLEECIRQAVQEDGPLSAGVLYRYFERWFFKRNRDVVHAPSQRILGEYMRVTGFSRRVLKGRVFYNGIRLFDEVRDAKKRTVPRVVWF